MHFSSKRNFLKGDDGSGLWGSLCPVQTFLRLYLVTTAGFVADQLM